MEQLENLDKESTLYLDIDGVLFPSFAQATELEYMLTLNAELSREWVHPVEFYHPEVIQALGEVASRSLVILSSSRMVGFLQDPVYEPVVEELQIQGALFIDSERPGSLNFKLDSVWRHWTGIGSAGLNDDTVEQGRGVAYAKDMQQIPPEGDRAVWVDDHILNTTLRRERQLNDLRASAGIATVVPNSATGLTLRDVEEIGRYL